MSIIKLHPENFQTYKLIANPRRVFHSKSESGITGSVVLFTDSSTSLKEYVTPGSEESSSFDDNDLTQAESKAFGSNADGSIPTDVSDAAENYLEIVNNRNQGSGQTKRLEVQRFTPGVKPNKVFGRKRIIKDGLFPHYRYKYRNLEWGYTNYNSINFFHSENTPEDAALIYPANPGTVSGDDINYYAPSSSFTFDFYVKPKVNKILPAGSAYDAGTILHMSSCYAISIVSGSSVGTDGLTDKFRILFQLSQSADIAPSDAVLGTSGVTSTHGDPGFMFASSDNSLNRDEWHHVSIRWPGSTVNAGSGSIVIDGATDKTFVITSGSTMQSSIQTPGIDDPNALFVGNYYEGTNSGAQSISRYFNPSIAEQDGLTEFVGVTEADPVGTQLRHPLSAEIHEIKIFDTYKSDAQINSLKTAGLTTLPSDLLFYLPPFFVEETRTRQVYQTPFFTTSGSSNDPFNVALSFGVGGLEINLENFSREFIRKEYPRCFNMSSSMTSTSVFQEGQTSDQILYSSGSSINRLYSILPCDNGKFSPNFQLLSTGSANQNKFTDEFGIERLDLVYLDNLVSTASLPAGLRSTEYVPARTFTSGTLSIPGSLETDEELVEYNSGSFIYELQGASPEDPSVDPGSILTVLQRTGDPSSNQVVIFDASNLFYGDRIRPNTVTIEDASPFNVSGSFSLTVKDDGLGSLYRCDTPTNLAAKWASVGNVIYEEGLIVLKSPHLSLFGVNDYKISFEGEKCTYVFEVSIPVEENLHNSSSNPQYRKLRPTPNYNETAEDFTYITGVQLHDNNLNVIGRAHFAQPYVKREEDRVVVKLRMDF